MKRWIHIQNPGNSVDLKPDFCEKIKRFYDEKPVKSSAFSNSEAIFEGKGKGKGEDVNTENAPKALYNNSFIDILTLEEEQNCTLEEGREPGCFHIKLTIFGVLLLVFLGMVLWKRVH